MKNPTTTTVKNLSALIPRKQLEMSKTDLTKVVKATSSNDLHITYTKLKGFMDLFMSVVKNEFVVRAKKLKAKNERMVTDIGVISFNERSNYVFDTEKIERFIKTKHIAKDLVYDYSYALVTKNAKVLSSLEDKGYITKSSKISAKKVEKLAEKYPSILNYVKNSPTEFVKGL